MGTMDCRRATELLPDYSVGVLDRRTHGAVADHLSDCPGCRGEMSAMEHALSLLEQHCALAPPPGLWNGVVNRIAAEATPVRPWRWAWLLQRPARAFVLGAAGLAVAAGVTFMPRGSHSDFTSPGPFTAEMSALTRQHALTQAEAPLGERAVWEEEAGPATLANEDAKDESSL